MLRIVSFLITIFIASSPTAYADVWLTDHEARFLEALGRDVTIDGKQYKLASDISKLKSIAKDAPSPLRGHILEIAQAYEQMQMTSDERAELERLMEQGAAEVQRELGIGLLGALLGDDPWEMSVNTTNRILRSGTISKAWVLQTKIISRGVDARQKADAALKKITDNFEKKIGQKRSPADVPFKAVIEKDKLYIDAKCQAKASLPVVQLTIHKNSTGGKWTGLNMASGAVLNLMGVKEMNLPRMGEGAALSIAQERAMNLPLVSTMLLPALDAGQTVRYSFDLPARSILGIERIEAKLWSSEGYCHVTSIDGFDMAKSEMLRLMDLEQRRAQAKAQNNPFGLKFLLPSSAQRSSFPKPDKSDALYPGSVWRGTYTQKQPKANPLPVELIIDSRDGKYFTGQLLNSGRHFRFIRGELTDGKIRFAHPPGDKDIVPLHTGTLKGEQINVSYSGVVGQSRVSGTITMDYVPPKK